MVQTPLSVAAKNLVMSDNFSRLKSIEVLVMKGAVATLPSSCLALLHAAIIVDYRPIIRCLITNGMSQCNADLHHVF